MSSYFSISFGTVYGPTTDLKFLIDRAFIDRVGKIDEFICD